MVCVVSREYEIEDDKKTIILSWHSLSFCNFMQNLFELVPYCVKVESGHIIILLE